MCGAAVEEELFPVLPALTPESTAQPPAAQILVPQAPYAAFVRLALGLGLCLSVMAFNVSHNLAQGEWRVWPWSLAAYPLAVLCLLRMPRTWRGIESIPDELGRHQKLLGRSAGFALLSIVIALVVGRKIGTDGRETDQLIDDFHEMSRIGSRISDARNSVERNVAARKPPSGELSRIKLPVEIPVEIEEPSPILVAFACVRHDPSDNSAGNGGVYWWLPASTKASHAIDDLIPAPSAPDSAPWLPA